MPLKRVFKKGSETTYRGIKYRSRWEVYVAKLLLYGDIYFMYEPRRFFFSKSLSYLPDFYLPSYGTYVEVKGSLSKKDKLLLSIFTRTHKLKYLGKKELMQISRRSAAFLSSPDMKEYVPSKSEVERFKRFLES
jgi:hypothetical protein